MNPHTHQFSLSYILLPLPWAMCNLGRIICNGWYGAIRHSDKGLVTLLPSFYEEMSTVNKPGWDGGVQIERDALPKMAVAWLREQSCTTVGLWLHDSNEGAFFSANTVEYWCASDLQKKTRHQDMVPRVIVGCRCCEELWWAMFLAPGHPHG